MTSAPNTKLLGNPKLWVPGDWNAFFGFGTNILVNLLTLTAEFTVWPATTIDAARVVVPELDAIVKVTFPVPVPVVPPVSTTHVALA